MEDTPLTYRTDETWEWNLRHAPSEPEFPPAPSSLPYTFCGIPISAPLGVSAGPLLSGRWILHYAALGFDVLTYKTVRSVPRDCYPLPNLQPVTTGQLDGSEQEVPATDRMNGSWAVSFGMPSVAPDVWRADVAWTRERLPAGKVLVVSVVGTEVSGGGIDELARDYAQCARWAVDAGADAIEMNFSCPNVTTTDGQLYHDPRAASQVASAVHAAVTPVPLIAKVGRVENDTAAAELVSALNPWLDALAMTNSIAANVRDAAGRLLFDGGRRGICGDATRTASLSQVRTFAEVIDACGAKLLLIGVGGISTATHVREYLDAGAESVQLATAAMTNPRCAQEIREELSL